MATALARQLIGASWYSVVPMPSALIFRQSKTAGIAHATKDLKAMPVLLAPRLIVAPCLAVETRRVLVLQLDGIAPVYRTTKVLIL